MHNTSKDQGTTVEITKPWHSLPERESKKLHFLECKSYPPPLHTLSCYTQYAQKSRAIHKQVTNKAFKQRTNADHLTRQMLQNVEIGLNKLLNHIRPRALIARMQVRPHYQQQAHTSLACRD